jgi:hypothetical protein
VNGTVAREPIRTCPGDTQREILAALQKLPEAQAAEAAVNARRQAEHQ